MPVEQIKDQASPKSQTSSLSNMLQPNLKDGQRISIKAESVLSLSLKGEPRRAKREIKAQKKSEKKSKKANWI
mgnify:CR=1 FL=1